MSAELIECFNNTYKMALEDSRLKSDTSSSVKNTVVYKENYKARLVNRADFNAGIDVIVEETTSFVAARRYSGESKKGVINKVAVLNFANPHVPGGGVTRGAKAQEESLCRSSNLYPCLISKSVTKKYYEYNKAKDRFFSDRIIYSPSVVIFKDDGNVPPSGRRAEGDSGKAHGCTSQIMCIHSKRRQIPLPPFQDIMEEKWISCLILISDLCTDKKQAANV